MNSHLHNVPIDSVVELTPTIAACLQSKGQLTNDYRPLTRSYEILEPKSYSFSSVTQAGLSLQPYSTANVLSWKSATQSLSSSLRSTVKVSSV